jgi:hypothetical protein
LWLGLRVQTWFLVTTWSEFWNAWGTRRSNHDGPLLPGPKEVLLITLSTLPQLCATICLAALLGACSSIGLGISVPLVPGISIGVGVGSGGVNAGVSAGRGPVSVGVSQSGQVTGSAGVGASTGIGGASVGVGVGTSTVIHDLNDPDRLDKAPAR